jgi:hypothetical protein
MPSSTSPNRSIPKALDDDEHFSIAIIERQKLSILSYYYTETKHYRPRKSVQVEEEGDQRKVKETRATGTDDD